MSMSLKLLNGSFMELGGNSEGTDHHLMEKSGENPGETDEKE